MVSGLTKRYVDEILELSGVRQRGLARILELQRISDKEAANLARDIAQRTFGHYRKNTTSIVKDLRGSEKCLKACYVGWAETNPLGPQGPDPYVRKFALYFDVIVMQDLLELFLRQGTRLGMDRDVAKRHLANSVSWLLTLSPWIEAGVVELVPAALHPTLSHRVIQYAEEDLKSADWRIQALKNEDLQLKGRAYLRYLSSRGPHEWPLIVQRKGGPKKAALYTALFGSSCTIGDWFFGSLLTHSSPTTDSKQHWRLLSSWLMRRAEKSVAGLLPSDLWRGFSRHMKAGRAWAQLDARELIVLEELSASKIIDIRDSGQYSFGHFRNDLRNAVDEIQGLKLDDEKVYREAANQAWNKVRESAKHVRMDSEKIRKKVIIDGVATLGLVSLTLGLLPFGYPALTTGIGAFTAAKDLAKQMVEQRELRKSSGYFLVELEKKGRVVS